MGSVRASFADRSLPYGTEKTGLTVQKSSNARLAYWISVMSDGHAAARVRLQAMRARRRVRVSRSGGHARISLTAKCSGRPLDAGGRISVGEFTR